MKNIYIIYNKKWKQYLNICSLALKADVICQLINTIYFVDKNSSPVVVFTEDSKVFGWIANLLLKAPYLTVVSLQGPQSYIEEMIEKYLFKVRSRRTFFKFNILVIAYQSLKIVANLLNLREILEQFSLLVMD
jgi:hypothetical protein